MKQLFSILYSAILFAIVSCNGQVQNKNSSTSEIDSAKTKVGGQFENNEFTYYGMPENISPVDTSPGWHISGEKLLLTGTIYEHDGKTPAPGVLLYYYQTNTEGRYLHKPEEKRSMPPNELGQTHGYIRGWVKTDSLGRYYIYTVRPGTYPTQDAPAHIHATIKEPNNISEYYIDEFVFDDDKLLTSDYRKRMENRCGSGVLRLVQKNDLTIGERNIILGLNIPDYPKKLNSEIHSGLHVGEDVFSFIPFHAWGPDKGTRTCPVCKYGWYQGIIYCVGNNPNWGEVKQWLTFLENESILRQKYLKVFFVYGNEKDYNKNDRQKELEKIGNELGLKNIALTYVPSFTDSESEVDLNKINPNVDNTFIIYKRSRVIAKFINFKPIKTSFDLVSVTLNQSVNEYFDIPKNEK
ncbi:MAG: hypothetical protein ACKVPJ_09305 [Chitinophagales bacterium]